MSVKSFKFVSPGVFINEIDNSFVPKSADAIGPVVIGRSTRGLGMTPIKVESYSQFVEMFGDTVAGNGGGDVYRDGNYQSPMYGTFAAKAFLNANVAPLTYIRLLGEQHTSKTSGGENGWKTTKNQATTLKDNGGAYGLWVWPSSSAYRANGQLGTASLAAVWYANSSSAVLLSGTMVGAGSSLTNNTAALGAVIASDSNNLFTVVLTGSGLGGMDKIKFGFDDSQDTFVRKVFNTNPQLTSPAGTFYPAASYKSAWLGESFEQGLRAGPAQRATAEAVMQTIAAGTETSLTHTTASTIQITDHRGTAVTYALVSGSTADASAPLPPATTADGGPKISATGSAAALATRLAAAINGSTGHNGTIAANASGGTVHLTQGAVGTVGNKSITLAAGTTPTEGNPISSKSDFTGGSGEPLVGTATTVVGKPAFGVMLPIALESNTATGPHNMQDVASRPEAKAGWFIGQDQNAAASYYPGAAQKLFRLKGRGHGEWLQRNVKVSIEKIRQSNTKLNPYGSFSVVLRSLKDTDSKVQVLERYDNLNLNPGSPDYIARRIGDKYAQWDTTNRMLKTYGEYDNKSKFVYVEMDSAVEGGATGIEALIPFGYYGPPKFSDITWNGLTATNGFITGSGKQFGGGVNGLVGNLTASAGGRAGSVLNGHFTFPINRLRHSASDGGLPDQRNAYFGFATTRTNASTRPDDSVADMHRLLYGGLGDDPTSTSTTGVDGFSYIFTLDDVQ